MSSGMTVALALATASQLFGVPQQPAPASPATEPAASAQYFDPVTAEGEAQLTERALSTLLRSQVRKAQAEREAQVWLADEANAPRVVCGMTVFPANPSADPAMVKAPPTDRIFSMRSVKPPLCRD